MLSFNFFNYKAEFTALDDIFLSIVPEISFRGGFGYVFKKTICTVKHRDCSKCLIYKHCPYYVIFESPAQKEKDYIQKYSFLPHPFVLNFPDSQQSKIRSNEKFSTSPKKNMVVLKNL